MIRSWIIWLTLTHNQILFQKLFYLNKKRVVISSWMNDENVNCRGFTVIFWYVPLALLFTSFLKNGTRSSYPPKSDKNSHLAYFPPFVNFIPMLSTKIPVYRVTFIIPRIFCDFPSFYNGPTHLSFSLMSNMSLKRQIFPRSQRKRCIRKVKLGSL